MSVPDNSEYPALMRILSRPRPSGSKAERETLSALQDWLQTHAIPHRLQAFSLYPYFFICIGIWMICSYSLLALAVWLRWGWAASLIAVFAILGGLLDTTLDIPLVTWPGRTMGHNLLMEFGPTAPDGEPPQNAEAVSELVISAHYDSKTELLDHTIRTFFVKNLRIGIALAVILGLIAPLERFLAPTLARQVHTLAVFLTLPLLLLTWGLGLNLSIKLPERMPSLQSQGAVDNGAACAILLGLAQRVQAGEVQLNNTHLTLALFGGEEVNMQGSRAFVNSRAWPPSSKALNLEIMAQDGVYATWQQDGTALKLLVTDPTLNQAITEAVLSVTGTLPHPAGPINSDGYSFLRAGIPATTLGTFDIQLQARGFHRPSDNLSRVQMNRLPEAVEVLEQFIRKMDETNG